MEQPDSPPPVVQVEATITDIDIPIAALIRFLIKLAIAALPAMIALFVLAALFWGALFALFSGARSATGAQ